MYREITLPRQAELRTAGAGTERYHAVWVVVPAFNERPLIGETCRQLLLECANVVVVDDGSDDGTGTEARAAGAVVIRHALNLGQGAALQTGIDYCLSKGAPFVCTFDADGQHATSSIRDMFAALTETGADIAIGSRFAGVASNMPWGRRLLLKGAVAFTRIHSGLDVSDTHNGLRLMTAYAAERIQIEQPRMAHASEILRKIAKRGLSAVEVPTKIVYTGYSLQKGQSTFSAVKILIDLFYDAWAR